MRKLIAVLPLVAASACGGGGPESVGSVAAPAGATAVAVVAAGNGSGVATNTGTATATTPSTSSGTTGSTNSGGTGTGVTSGTSPVGATSNTHFLSVTSDKSFDLVGGAQSLTVSTSGGGTLYSGNASTVRAPSGTVSYSPRDGIFTVTLTDTKANVNSNLRFQDPGHRTDFNPQLTPQWGVPDLQGFNYLESVGTSVTDASTFFYQRPGTSTVYVSLAGYVRNNVPTGGTTNTLERGAFVFGDQTARGQIPASGGGTYRGGFIASMIFNPTYDASQSKSSAYQWVQGNSALSVDFGKSTVSLSLAGTVNAANMSGFQVANSGLSVATGSGFNAAGTATIDLVKTGGFTGQFQSASFTDPTTGAVTNVDFAGITPGSSSAGASSIDGAFYGPGAVNVGGNMRIVGGLPDQRVDILGAFTGAKQPN